MKKFFIRLICCFIPGRQWRYQIRHKLSAREKLVMESGNNIWLIAPNGMRRRVDGLPGCTFTFLGSNNNVYLYEPINNLDLFVNVTADTNITIYSGGQMKLCVVRGSYGCHGAASLEIGPGFISTGQVKIELCNSNIKIGRDCLFASNITIRAGDYHAVIDKNTRRVLNYDKDVKIGNHVWIAADVFISKGVFVSDNSVIGAHSVVTRKFDEANVVIAGAPAKIVKRGIDWDIRSILDYENSLG